VVNDRSSALAPLTCLAMVAFAANSLLARLALRTTAIDAASFTAIRLVSGAVVLLLILRFQRQRLSVSGTSWWSAILLFTYAAAFSFAYRAIGAGAGALVLFASAQLMMIGYGIVHGERASVWGVLLASGGLLAFLLPSASSPPPAAAGLMAVAGCAWGGFSLLGRRAPASPVANTTASFVLSVPLALALLGAGRAHLVLDWTGALYALLSGSLASALGYAVWYWVRSRLTAISAGAVQLSVPLLSAVLGVVLLGERLASRSIAAALVTLAGIAWVTWTASARPGGTSGR
jgi:drug/metabolite transporter (DMT)-like permease